MAHSDSRLFRSFRHRAMWTILAGAALGTILVASFAAAMPGAVKTRTLATGNSVEALAADGGRAALVVWSSERSGRCGVIVWEPNRRRVVRFQHPCEGSRLSSTRAVALAGTRVAWQTISGVGRERIVETATLARRKPFWVAFADAFDSDAYGDFARRPIGDGTLLAFTFERRCKFEEGGDCPRMGDIVFATVWRVAGRGHCPGGGDLCSRVAEAEGELSVLAVDAGRIAVRTKTGLRLLTADGAILRDFDLKASAAALSGNRLAVRTANAVEVYDTGSGQRTARFPATSHLRLEDLDRDILVTASGRTVTLRRLGDGRTTTIRAGGTARAQLEPPGLFVAAGRRVTFTPMREVLRRFGD